MIFIVLALTPAARAAEEPVPVVIDEYLVRQPAGQPSPFDLADATRINDEWLLLSAPTNGSPEATAAALEQHFGVRVVPNLQLLPAGPQDEPLFDEQWSLHNHGQTGGTIGADISAPEAWTVTLGVSNVIVAVVDSGVDLDHVDLSSQLWANAGEIPGNGVDDDGNGYVDDVAGWDFIEGDNLPADALGHGTKVAGLIGAAINGVGITGVAPGVRLMPVRVCSTSCPLSAIFEGIDYATANGASIINLSLGGVGSGYDPIEESIQHAASAGVLVVAAAGNAGTDNDTSPYFPAAFPDDNIISVASTDHDDGLSSWSNFGVESVDLAAPGESILSTAPSTWAIDSGTSFAAPLVSGTAALMRSLRPTLTPGEVRIELMANADPVAALAGTSASGARLNAGAAVWQASRPQAVVSGAPPMITIPAEVVFDGGASSDPNGTIVSYHWDFSDGIELEGATVTRRIVADRDVAAILTVIDDDGLEDSAQVAVAVNAPPRAALAAAPLLGEAPLDVHFDASGSIDPDGAITEVTWTFGDGAAGAGPEINHRFETAGIYETTVVVIDDTGASDSTTRHVLAGRAFTDTKNSVFKPDITWLSAMGITNGCSATRFCPERMITRGEAAAFLRRAFDLPAGPDAFHDDDGHPFEADVDALAAAGVTYGCHREAFCPDRPITRGELAAFLRRALSLPASGASAFGDDDGHLFEADADALAATGILRGCNPPANDRSCLDATATRAQFAAMLRRALDG